MNKYGAVERKEDKVRLRGLTLKLLRQPLDGPVLLDDPELGGVHLLQLFRELHNNCGTSRAQSCVHVKANQHQQKPMTRKETRDRKRRSPLTIDILCQLGVCVPKPGHLISGVLELVRHLRELLVGCLEVCASGGQVLLQLRHLRLERHLLLGSGLGSGLGGGFRGGGGLLGSLIGSSNDCR